MRALFTYGTLALPVVAQAVTGRQFASSWGWVRGFERRQVRDAVYPGLIENPARSAPGRVYFAVDEETLAVLDRFEDWLYERRTLEVALVEGRVLHADAWVVPRHYEALLARTPWDPSRFARHDLPAYLRGCRAFRAEDRARNLR